MDIGQLIKDIFTLNITSFITRKHKLIAFLKRSCKLKTPNFSSGKNLFEIPIIINNRNRFTYLKMMVDRLKKAGYSNIIVLDNDSSYEPLLRYYDSGEVKVIYLKKNFGYLALWKSGTYTQFYTDYYVYSDPDILIDDNCPDDFMKYFMELLTKYPGIEKVGFGLLINDLPDSYEKKQEVISWENKYWKKTVEPDVYDAPLDTTFALYKPYTNGEIWVQNALRTGGNYVARHLPWYENSANQTEENKFYQSNIIQGVSHWIQKK